MERERIMSVGSERRSISGIRGAAETLPVEKVARYTRAYGTLMRDLSQGNTIVLGRDTRATSRDYAAAAAEALNACGWDVIDIGIAPTPTVQIAINKFEAAGGVVITASHNPQEYNGVKYLQYREGHGMFLVKEQVQQLFDVYENGVFEERRRGELRTVAEYESEFDAPPYTSEFIQRHKLGLEVDNAVILDHHVHRVVSMLGRTLDRIRGMDFRVAFDGCGGAGVPINYVLLDVLYCRAGRFNDEPGVFKRPIEPTPRNLQPFCDFMAQADEPYDAAFAVDCDNDRCVLIAHNPDENRYEPLEEDYTFGISVDQVLSTAPAGSTVVTNWSTSQMLFDICNEHHANLRRAPTGEVYTATDAAHYCAAIAGEGSCAGVIDPRVGLGRDVLVAVAHTLSALACKQKPLYEVVRSMPHYHKVNRDSPSTLTVAANKAMLESLQAHYGRKDNIFFINREDGLIVYFNDRSRIQIRASNTEPILRVRSEAPEEADAEALVNEALEAIKKLESEQ
jgi:phosphomannomutase